MSLIFFICLQETPSEKHPVDIEQCEDLGGGDSGFPLGNASEKKCV
jgi:hypothetical protein